MSVATLAAPRTPPHDPYTLLLGGRQGWPLLDGAVAQIADGGGLQLPRSAAALRALTEPSGSFGGLRLPYNVAAGPDGETWLLRTDPSALLRFDPCLCGFTEVDCFGTPGPGPGQLDHPRGIALTAGHLFICDTGNRRLQVVLVPHLVVSGLWRAPMDWQPTDVAVDRRFRVHVADPANGMVHRFGWSGRYLGNTAGLGTPLFVAAGEDGVYASGPSGAYRIGEDGTATQIADDSDANSGAFCPPPCAIAAYGSMQLGALCAPPTSAWFDTRGSALPAPPPPGPPPYERTAMAVIGPLDSQLDECVWHRVVVTGELPAGCTVSIATTTANTPLSDDQVQALPAWAWANQPVCTELSTDGWDALIRSPGGRYLWMTVQLNGNGISTPQLDEFLVEFPRISLRRYLPAVYGAEPNSADFTDRLLAVFDRQLRDTESRIDELPAALDPRSTEHLDWLASWVGLRPDRRMPESVQRALVANAARILDLRGTVAGLRMVLLTALGLDGIECDPLHGRGSCPQPRQTCPPTPVQPSAYPAPPLVLEHFRLRRWFEAGASTLGDRTVLWGQSIARRSQLDNSAQLGVTALNTVEDPVRDPFHVYAHRFTVFVPASAGNTRERRRSVEQLVQWASPAHTEGHVQFVEPRLRIGVQASIGLDTVVARLPAGITLGDTTLGPASVLTHTGQPALNKSTVGTSTSLG